MQIKEKKKKDFFKDWSDEMAYILGFFVADGCMIKNNRGACYIEFHITDKDVLLFIKKQLGIENKIELRRGVKDRKETFRLQIGSKEIFEDLLTLGMRPRKSKDLNFPSIKKEYLDSFVRGYFDGDGNVYIVKRKDRNSEALLSGFTSGSENFLKELHYQLKMFAKINGGSLYNRKGFCRLYFSTNDSLKLYDFMYKKGNAFCLKRKRVIFEKFMHLEL